MQTAKLRPRSYEEKHLKKSAYVVNNSMPYSSNPDPYIDAETGVFKNLLSIDNQQDLDNAEADISATVIASMSNEPSGNFDLEHLKNIHWEIFSAIYSWAGEIRTVEIAKGETRFANSDIIEQAASQLFKMLHADNLLKDSLRHEFVRKLAHYYSEVNVLHPFREGNGRTERMFFSQLVVASGYRLAWENLNADENIEACARAYKGDESSLVDMLDRLLVSSSSS